MKNEKRVDEFLFLGKHLPVDLKCIRPPFLIINF